MNIPSLMNFDITLPTSWADLSQNQLAYLLRCFINTQRLFSNMAPREAVRPDAYSALVYAAVGAKCLVRWGGIHIISRAVDGWLVRINKVEGLVDTLVVAAAVNRLSWISTPPSVPVRLDRIGEGRAVAADFSDGVSFGDYLALENFWQGYCATVDDSLLLEMAKILYKSPELMAKEYELLGVFYWFLAVKSHLSKLFPHFFQPVDSVLGGASSPSYDDLRRAADTQIRALTKGDPVKEAEVLALPVLRALTELDAKAREYQEFKKKYPSS